MFSTTAGPVSWLGVKRKRHPGLSLDQLPPIDIVLISHNHYDHLDLPSLKFISKQFAPKIIVPLGDKNWLEKEGLTNIIELDWWESIPLSACITVHFVPAQHSSGRGLFDRDKSFWGGFVVEHPGITFFHAGDTGYADHFKAIGERFKIDIAMLPIGAYKPSWFLQHVHMNPSQAVQAHKDIKAIKSFGMHFETFPLSALGYGEARNTLNNILKATTSATADAFMLLQIGESYLHPIKNKCTTLN